MWPDPYQDMLGDYERYILNADERSEAWAERMLAAADLERKAAKENREDAE